ncbi:MAG: hypothetical protein HFG25_14190 [Lachnospiraceae bacterium]|nr:hypothetical protein [Lachnospiraceae bacterium]
MLSRNLVKQVFTVTVSDEKRVIDTNGVLRQRREMAELQEKQPMKEGFVSGLAAETIEVSSAGESESGNVIKANEEAKRIESQAREQAESLLAQAREEAENIRREAVAAAEAEKEQIRETARKQGHNEGLTQAKAQAEAQVEAVKKEYQVKEKQLEAFYQQQLQELEPRLVDAITEIYQHFFHVELSSYRDILTYLITAAMRKADGSRSFTIRVSREDYPYVSMQKKQIITEGGAGSCAVEVTEDMSLEKNECLIETDGGIFDCGLGTQLAELKQKLALLSWSRE